MECIRSCGNFVGIYYYHYYYLTQRGKIAKYHKAKFSR